MFVAIIMILLVVTMLVAGGVFFYVYTKYLRSPRYSAQLKRKVVTSSPTPAPEETVYEDFSLDTKSFLDFESIEDYALNLGGLQYRAIIECSSISYGLKTPQEREMIEYTFQAFLNSLTFPIVLYVQTRAIDNTKMIARLEQRAEAAVNQHEALRDYANAYINGMKELPYITGLPKCKKKYIIISYEETTDMSELSMEERETFCLDELYERALTCCENLQGIGISTTILNRNEIAKIIYAAMNRNEFHIVESIIRGELNTLAIQGRNKSSDFTPKAVLKTLLYQTENKIKKLEDSTDNADERELYKKLYETFHLLQEQTFYTETFNELLDFIRQRAVEKDEDNSVSKVEV